MFKRNRELWLALIAMIMISLFYIGVVNWHGSVPAARSFFGHSLGAIGLIMMLMTETLYSLRKRSHSARWGKMADWLSFHIFTGLVGPYLALLHTAWKFNGLAGLVLLMTMIVVLSGFIGRYIYTSIPRTADGIELQAEELQRMIELFEEELAQPTGRAVKGASELLPQQKTTRLTSASRQRALATGTHYDQFSVMQISNTSPLQEAIIPLSDSGNARNMSRKQQAFYKELRSQHHALQRQLANLAWSRRMMAAWHAIHVPIGLAMFSAAFIHVGAAIYYATLLH